MHSVEDISEDISKAKNEFYPFTAIHLKKHEEFFFLF